MTSRDLSFLEFFESQFILRITSLCYFRQNDSRIQLRRVGAVVGLVLENVVNSMRKQSMYCPGTVFKERKGIDVAPVYYEEHAGRANSDFTEL